MSKLTQITEYQEWQALVDHHKEIHTQTMRDWFSADDQRFVRFSHKVGDLLLDYSRNRVTEKTISLLCRLAERIGLANKISALFSGIAVNTSEYRAALHTALRDKYRTSITINSENIAEQITTTLVKMQQLTTQIHEHRFLGLTNKPIRHVVNIGIGGSYLGPQLGIEALRSFAVHELQFHFISSVDDVYLTEILQKIDPETTLFIISSKSFTTLETLTNAKTVAAWLKKKLGHEAIRRHFIAITKAHDKALDFGIAAEHIFPIWDWVGGRYSIWSAIGLPLMLMLGEKQFQEFLDGAFIMDQHFRSCDFEKNIPVLMALIGIWYINFFHTRAHVIAPYGQSLRYLPIYLQQADMESNGKSVDITGQTLTYATGPVVFGGEGCHGQHAYHQLLHQGTEMIPVDFILTAQPEQAEFIEAQRILLASGLSQAEALMRGKTNEEAYNELLAGGHSVAEAKALAPHLAIPGNRPSNVILLKALTPNSLGTLLALYEHKIFVQAAIWHINPFDQWGVELGKQLLPTILHPGKNSDTAIAGLLRQVESFIQGE